MHSKSLTGTMEKTRAVVYEGSGACFYGLLSVMMEAQGSLGKGLGTREPVCLGHGRCW